MNIPQLVAGMTIGFEDGLIICHSQQITDVIRQDFLCYVTIHKPFYSMTNFLRKHSNGSQKRVSII